MSGLNNHPMRIALVEPDMAGNVGTILRLCACFGVGIDVVEPCGFPFSDKRLKRSGMDYAQGADIKRHADWAEFYAAKQGRLILLTTKSEQAYHDFVYQPGDILVLGSEGSGAPAQVHDAADSTVRIPLQPGFRSLNVAVAAGIVLAEALRQTKELPL